MSAGEETPPPADAPAPEPRPCKRECGRTTLAANGVCSECRLRPADLPSPADDLIFVAPEVDERPCKRRGCGRTTVAAHGLCHECWQGVTPREEVAANLGRYRNAVPENFSELRLHGPDVGALEARVKKATRAIEIARGKCGAFRVVLLGPSGAGKTSLGAAMLYAWFERRGVVPLFLPSLRLAQGKSEVNEEWVEAPMVLLDNVGNEKKIPSNLLADFVELRDLHHRPLWVTTWMPHEFIAHEYGDAVARKTFEGAAIIDFYAILGLEKPKLPAKAGGRP